VDGCRVYGGVWDWWVRQYSLSGAVLGEWEVETEAVMRREVYYIHGCGARD